MTNTDNTPEPGSYWHGNRGHTLWGHVDDHFHTERTPQPDAVCTDCKGTGQRRSGRPCTCNDGTRPQTDRLSVEYHPAPPPDATHNWRPSSNNEITFDVTPAEAIYLAKKLLKAAAPPKLPNHPNPDKQWEIDHASEAVQRLADRFFNTAEAILNTEWWDHPGDHGTAAGRYAAAVTQTATSHHYGNADFRDVIQSVTAINYADTDNGEGQ